MQLLDKIKGLFRSKQPERKAMGTAGWWNGAGFGHTYDSFGGQAEPSFGELVKAYDDITYACVSYIASNLAHVRIPLYVRTATGERQPKCMTRALTGKNAHKIRQKYYGTDIKEVVDHPLLKLLNKCNPYHNRHDLLELTSIFLDTTGNGYWLKQNNQLGIPEELYLLPSHLVTAERDSNYYVRKWVFGQGAEQKKYDLDQVIHFKYNNPLDAYGLGVSPLRAAWQRRAISAKELSYLDNYLSNMGKPDAVLSIKDSINPVEAERVAKEFRHRYQGQGNGGLLVLDGTMNLSPINFPAKDMAELELYQVVKTVICNCFHIPPDIFELGVSSNRSTKEAAIYAFACDCLRPRLEGIVQKLNDELVPYFDDRFFFEAEDVVPEDKEAERADEQMLISQQVITRDEARVRHGYPSEEWAKVPLLPSGVLPASFAFQQADESTQPAPEPEEPKIDRAAQATAIQTLQQAVYGGQLPREAALAQLTILYGFTPEQAGNLLPDIAPKPPEQPQAAPQADDPPQAAPKPADDQEQPQEQPEAKKAVVKQKMMRPLAPGPFIKAIQKVFAQMSFAVTSKMKTVTKATSVLDWFDVEAWTDTMTDEMRPVVQAYYDHGARETIGLLNLTGSMFNTVQPNLKQGVDKATLLFCRETVATTRMDLEAAQAALKQEITEGLIQGDVKNEMMRRVQKVFVDAENYRAFTIGVTEASRGQHAAMEITSKESGVVAGKTWLLSDDACPICLPLSGKTVGLGENFTKIGTGPYAEIPYPPAHPSCRCTLTLETN